MVIESMHEKTEEAMCRLLQSLFRSFVITIDQMRNVSSCITTVSDRSLDVPSLSGLRARVRPDARDLD